MGHHVSPLETQASLRIQRDALRSMLLRVQWTHFVTLSTNGLDHSHARMTANLKAWDARVNRRLSGKRFMEKPDERMHWYAFPEKLDVNPHWHLVVQLSEEQKERLRDPSFFRSFSSLALARLTLRHTTRVW